MALLEYSPTILRACLLRLSRNTEVSPPFGVPRAHDALGSKDRISLPHLYFTGWRSVYACGLLCSEVESVFLEDCLSGNPMLRFMWLKWDSKEINALVDNAVSIYRWDWSCFAKRTEGCFHIQQWYYPLSDGPTMLDGKLERVIDNLGVEETCMRKRGPRVSTMHQLKKYVPFS